METRTNIRRMMAGNIIVVPDYQRAYSWEVDKKGAQVNVFLEDLLDYIHSSNQTPYYFGHFLFEQRSENEYAVIDGQQRLTTILIFVCAAFRVLNDGKGFIDDIEKQECYEDMVKRNRTYRFTTVGYDNLLMRDYVIDNTKSDKYGIDTTSGERIINAYDFFVKKLSDFPEEIEKLLDSVSKALCTTHIVETEAEAIQMFIFQNNRGKKPSNLELIKAQFMYNIHLYGGSDVDSMIKEVKCRFENIYKNISKIEYKIDEDDVLSRTMQVFFNSLWRDNAMDGVAEALTQENRLDFILKFTKELERTFEKLTTLFEDSIQNVDIEYALLNGHYNIVLPFFIKAYNKGLPIDDIALLGKALGDIMLRDAIVSTRADLRTRLNDVFEKFTGIQDTINKINWMKTNEEWWWHYWNNTEVSLAINTNWKQNDHKLAKIILWRYELDSDNFKEFEQPSRAQSYGALSFRNIASPQLEHIAPQTQNGEKEAAGYDEYDEVFLENYLLRLGNFLLLSGTHNESIGNKPFEVKRDSYRYLAQQREIQYLTDNDRKWDKDKILTRNNKIAKFLIEKC